MLSRQDSLNLGEDNEPELDEGWWSAVLADEISQKEHVHEVNLQDISVPIPPSVDWEMVQGIFNRDEVLILQVQGYNRGGVLVQGTGVQGFVPVSHLVDMPGSINEDDRQKKLATYVGRALHLKIIECEPSQERIVFSERAALAGEGRRKQLFQSLKPGSIVQGIVTNVTDFGVFIDLGGVEGLIHVSELSWGRVQHPKEVLLVGQKVQALVLQVCEESSRVALSLKRLFSNPWETLIDRYKPGDVIAATITDILRFGAFARLEEGVEGLIHISSINLPPGKKDLENIFQNGQNVQVRILHIDVERRRLGLGLVTFE
jgi:small subunit ribosomal protein S1